MLQTITSMPPANIFRKMASNDFPVKIRQAVRGDAPIIARTIIEAVGEEITLGFAGSRERIGLVYKLFTDLAECDDSQYSYLNTLIAETTDGEPVGAIISYDGADLRRLRERFIQKANKILGYDMKAEEMPDEASPDEIYLDSLCVFEPFRGHGIASRLINAAVMSHQSSSKPSGLLVDKDNLRARRLYERLGFTQVGETPFAGTLMDHLQRR